MLKVVLLPFDVVNKHRYFLFTKTTGRNCAGADAQAADLSGFFGVGRHHVAVEDNPACFQPGFRLSTSDAGVTEVNDHLVIVRSSCYDPEPLCRQLPGHICRMFNSLFLELLEFRVHGKFHDNCLGRYQVDSTGPLGSREDASVQFFGELFSCQDDTAPPAHECLVAREGDKIAVGNGAWDCVPGNQADALALVFPSVSATTIPRSTYVRLPEHPVSAIAVSALLKLAEWYESRGNLVQGGESCPDKKVRLSPPAPGGNGDGSARPVLDAASTGKATADAANSGRRRGSATRAASRKGGGR